VAELYIQFSAEQDGNRRSILDAETGTLEKSSPETSSMRPPDSEDESSSGGLIGELKIVGFAALLPALEPSRR
jgi:hypothetical protein